METREKTCEERIDSHLESRLDDLRVMLRPDPSMVELIDDGTMDTVLRVGDEEFRYDAETAAEWRDEDTGEFDVDLFVSDSAWDEVCETLWDRFAEYGLSWDYVEGDESGEPGYFRYQISWGGPSDEFRFFAGYGGELVSVEYWFLDWFDGASRTLHGDDYQLLHEIWDYFAEIGAVESAYEQARG